MKQLLQNIKEGKAEIVDVPIPMIREGFLLVKNSASIVSAGTERMVVEFAEKNLIAKARSRPDLLKQVIDKSLRDGVIPTLKTALNRLDKPMALGYSSAGVVIQVGAGITDFSVGDRVACAGSGYASHAEYVLVPVNLAAKIPDDVPYEEAAFATLASIALHGFRLANPQIGDRVAIIGLGLLGLMMVDICLAAGVQAFGTDLDPSRVELANKKGIVAVSRETALEKGKQVSQNIGFDTVFICADTPSEDPITLAGNLSRDRGTVVVVGNVNLNVPRKSYYEKEINILISRSYGPGRYDSEYEEKGADYPIGYVRWTEGRNLSAVLELMAAKKIDVKSLISHRFHIDDGTKAYDLISGKLNEQFLGIVLEYSSAESQTEESKSIHIRTPVNDGGVNRDIRLGVLGTGLYASSIFLPILSRDSRIRKVGICSAKGLNATHAAKKYGFEFVTSDENEILNHEDINTVVILTRHGDHARQIIQAIKNRKHIYCEKPLVIQHNELKSVLSSYSDGVSHLMVGFNRRFSPFVQKIRSFLGEKPGPMSIHYRINAGYLPKDHWLHDPIQGGGRLIGEGCHFLDLCLYLAASPAISVRTVVLPNLNKYMNDNFSVTVVFENGSIATIDYLSNGDKNIEKERLEIFCDGKVVQLNDFRRMALTFAGKTERVKSLLDQDKGQLNTWNLFVEAVRNGKNTPIDIMEIVNSTILTLAADRSMQEQKEIFIRDIC